MNDIVERYLDIWNETDTDRRRALIEDFYTDDARYVDPMVEAHGRAEIDATIAAVQDKFPGFVFIPAGPADTHHRQTRFTWGLGPQNADPLVIGFDVVVGDDSGRVTGVFGFLDKPPG
jgi:hypothetical protein